MQNPIIDAILKRRSAPLLDSPAPNSQQLEMLVRCASRAADHGNLRPWRFLYLENEHRERLSEALVKMAESEDPALPDFKRTKMAQKPYRAPAILVAISRNIENPKVPVLEQQMATAAAVQNLLLAAFSMGLGAYWRTGSACNSQIVKSALAVQSAETIVGFIYLGAAKQQALLPKPTDDWSNYLQIGLTEK